MSHFLQNLVIALNNGSAYALIALGYTMVYGVLRLINFAHSDVFMVGAFVGAYTARWLNPPTDAVHAPEQAIWQAGVGIMLAMLICGALGYAIERLAYRPLRKSPKLASLITAIGVSLLIEYLAQMQWHVGGAAFFGPSPQAYQPIAGSGNSLSHYLAFPYPVFGDSSWISLGWFQTGLKVIPDGVIVVWKDVMVIVTTVITLFVLRHIVLHTRTGKAMRAVSQNYDAARLMGINIDRVISFTFILGSMLAAIGGCLYGLKDNQCVPLMGLMPGLKAFVAAVIGGIGNIPGAAAGGLILGIIETYVSTVQYHNSAILFPYKDAIAFIILILMLLVKPEGIFGKAVPEKV